MDVGSMTIFASHGRERMTDRQVWSEDIGPAEQAAALGCDVLCPAGGLPYRKADAAPNLFATEALPVLKTWHAPAIANAAH